MRNIFRFGGVLLISLALATTAFAANGSHSGTTTAASTSTMTVTIPSVVAIDVESDATFNLTTLVGAGGNAGAACTNNIFPPAPGCTGGVLYDPTSTTTTATAPIPAPASDSLWIALFTNSTNQVQLSGQLGTFSAAVTTPQSDTIIRISDSGSNISSAINATGTDLVAGAGAATVLGSTTTSGPFGWSRYDQKVQLKFSNTSATFNVVAGSTATLTLTAGI